MPFEKGHDSSAFRRPSSVIRGAARGRRGSGRARGRGTSVRVLQPRATAARSDSEDAAVGLSGEDSRGRSHAGVDNNVAVRLEGAADGAEFTGLAPNNGSRSVGGRGAKSARGGGVPPILRGGFCGNPCDADAARPAHPRTPMRPDGMTREVAETLRDQDVRWADDVERARRGTHVLRVLNNISSVTPCDAAREAGIIDDRENSVNVVCSICQWVLLDPVQLKCEHSCCKDCMSSVISKQIKKKLKCPLCNQPFQIRDVPQGMRSFQTLIHSLPAWCPNGMDRTERAKAGARWVESNTLDVDASGVSSSKEEADAIAAVGQFGSRSKPKDLTRGPKSERNSTDDSASADEKVCTNPIYSLMRNCVDVCYLVFFEGGRACVCR